MRDTSGRSVRVRIGVRALVALSASVALLAFCGSALGAVASSQVTTPSDPTFLQRDPGHPSDPANTVTISGTAVDDGTPGNVDILCYYGTTHVTYASNVSVSYSGTSGTFTAAHALDAGDERTCTLRAVPTGTSPSDVSLFHGPRLGIGVFSTSDYTGGPASGQPYDFYTSASQLSGYGDYESFTNGGMYDANPLDPSKFVRGGDLFYANDTYDGLVTGATRSSVQVDGANAFGAAAAWQVCGKNKACAMSGIPTLTVTHSLDPATGDLTVTESEPLVKCSPDATTYPPTSTSCTSFAPTGVTVNRTIRQSHDGRQSCFIDSYMSTDGAAHLLDLVSLEDARLANTGYNFPWVDGSTYNTHTSGATETAAASAPASVYITADNTLADGDSSGAQGAITFGQEPNGFAFAAHGEAGSTHLTALFTRTVPASGSTTLTQVFSRAFTVADAHTLATQAEATLRGPTVAITSPSSSSTVTSSPVTASGTASASAGQGGLASVTIDGHAVTVAADGTWRTQVSLNKGSNTISAVATDGNGEQSQAGVTLTYAPLVRAPHTGPQGPPPVSRVRLDGKARFNGKAAIVKLLCSPDGSTCTGTITLRYTHTVVIVRHGKKRRHMVTVVLGSATYTLNSGQSKTSQVSLNRAGTRLLNQLHKIPTTDTVTPVQLNGKSPKAIHFTLTLQQKPRRSERGAAKCRPAPAFCSSSPRLGMATEPRQYQLTASVRSA